jgi:hypothetical protein
MSSNQKVISVKACFALLFYLIIPSIAIILILQSYPELSKDRFYTMIYWILPTSTLIVFFAQFSIFYKKGDKKRFILNIGFVIATMIWVYGLLGGSLVFTNQWNEFHFQIHITKYVILILTVASLNILYYTLEWRFYKTKQYQFQKIGNYQIIHKTNQQHH